MRSKLLSSGIEVHTRAIRRARRAGRFYPEGVRVPRFPHRSHAISTHRPVQPPERGPRTLHAMDPDDHVCLCFHVSLRKIANFVARENPRVASQISECLGAGTGCQWCVPFLRKLHQLHADGKPMDLPVSPEEYAKRRARYRTTGTREVDEGNNGGASSGDGPPREDGSE